MAHVVVTGSGSGIGLETALAFARRGDTVHGLVRDLRRASNLRARAASERLDVRIDGLDVTDGDAVVDVIGSILTATGPIDVLVNAAGIGSIGSVEEVDEHVARSIVETNLWGTFRVIRAVLPTMRTTGHGVIVNVSSINARRSANPALSIYGLSKIALSFLSASLHEEVATMGIRVITAEPGLVATDIYNKSRQPIDAASPYAALLTRVDNSTASAIAAGTNPALIATEIVAAVDDPATPSRVLMGDDARSSYGDRTAAKTN